MAKVTVTFRVTVTSIKDAMDPLREFFDRLADGWDAQQPPDREETLRRLLTPFAAMLGTARTILEVGTGIGALIPIIREVTPEARTVSIDLSHRMLRHARRRCPDALLLQADAHCLPLISGTADLVICHNAFPHFQDKPVALAELARVLCSGGHLLILHNLGREQVNAIHRGAGGAIGNDLLPAGDELEELLVRSGFGGVWVEDTADRYRAVAVRR